MENKNEKRKFIYEVTFSLLAIVSVALAVINMQDEYIFSHYTDYCIDMTINVIFIVDYLIRILTAENKGEFFRSNIPDLIAIIPFNSLFKAFRVLKLLKLTKLFKLVRIVAYLVRLAKRTGGILKQNGTIYLITFTVFIMFFSSVIISYSEHMSLGNSLWWSFVTTTTVGYGDISPTTTVGRVTAVILMLLGIGSIGMITGSISTFFIKKEEEEIEHTTTADEIRKCYDLYVDGAITEDEYNKLKESLLKNKISV